MTLLALGLVLSSAFLHASWNLLAKRASGGAAFTWLFAALTSLIYAPLALTYIALSGVWPGGLQVGFAVGSAVIHVAYFLSLQRGYAVGDLSLVYPLARGTGPLLATVAAIVLLGERPSSLALVGTASIVVSVFLLAGGSREGFGGADKRGAIGYGLLTGLLIATYTIWDGYAVGTLGATPLVYMWLSELIRTVLLTPYALTHRDELRLEWHTHRREAFGIAVLSPLAYIMVLTALTFTPVSYVAPAREISILLGTLFGARLLLEGDARRRLAAAGGMVLGVVLLALG